MKKNTKNQKRMHGFSLLEMLIVLVIMGILASIALPHYSQYKKNAYDTMALSDLRNVALAEEAYFLDAEKYLDCKDVECLQLPGIARISKGVILEIITDQDEFDGEAQHQNGSGKIYRWRSDQGGLIN